ncbi:MAG: 1-phosphofructokinase family hexose kinase [Acidobacteriia bacterium]|nr:1-phosphofructokinase family hexose kinase [Terriglobia bacterium]
MIVTVTINPAIERIINVDRLAFEDRAYINSSRESAGGRGLNVSCVIHSFGAKTLAVTAQGGATGKRLVQHLKRCGFPVCYVPIRSAIRTNLTITDKQGLTVHLNEAGPKLTRSEVANFEKVLREKLEDASWLMLCGSTPPGVPVSFYAELIGVARQKRVRTLLHAGGEVLRQGIEAKPTVVTPNQHEAERLLGQILFTRAHFLEAAERIRMMGPETVVLSLASRGAVAAFADGLVEAIPPSVQAISPIGGGDALAAGYTWAMSRRSKYTDALRWGVAAGTASALLPGMQFATLEQTKAVYGQVEIRRPE